MTSTAQVPIDDPVAQTHEQEALLLVELLRTSRVALLYGQAGTDKTGFLKSGLMPLLCRRAGDRLAQADLRSFGVVVPFPDRRGRLSVPSSKRRREIVVYCGHWTDDPMADLRASLGRALALDGDADVPTRTGLAAALENLCRRFDAQFVILLDRFEDVLRQQSEQVGVETFVAELAEAVVQPRLSANFLIALDDTAQRGLAGLRGRVPGLDDFSLKLAPRRSVAESHAPATLQPSPVSSSSSSGKKKVKKLLQPHVEVTVGDVYSMIESALSDIAATAAIDAPRGEARGASTSRHAPGRSRHRRRLRAARISRPPSSAWAGAWASTAAKSRPDRARLRRTAAAPRRCRRRAG